MKIIEEVQTKVRKELLMKKIVDIKNVRWIVIFLCLLELTILFIYFMTFGRSISTDHRDWDTFMQVFNGCTMAILTGINIWVFYRISTSIDKNTKNRAVKQLLFDTQSFLTQLRLKQYEELSLLINDIKVDLFEGKINEETIKLLKKSLMRMDQSLLFKNDSLGDSSMLFPLSEEILNLLKDRKDGYEVILQDKLAILIPFMEIYIFTQLLRDHDVVEYIDNHKGNIDSTFNCMDQLARKFSESLENNNSSN